jgi:predicted dehydrogenase
MLKPLPISSDRPLRIGILGAARIAPKAVIEPAQAREDVVITAIAARDADRARAFAQTHLIPHVASDYAALVARDDVDLVYNALPPSGHACWSIAAMEAGKHVLCEKPLVPTLAEALAMSEAAARTGQRLIEAYHHRFHPGVKRFVALAQTAVGQPIKIEADFSITLPYGPDELRWRADLGGGAMNDLGVYPLSLARMVAGREPVCLSARARMCHGVDEAMSVALDFGAGLTADLRADMGERQHLRVWARVTGAEGRVTMTHFIAPQFGAEIILERGGQISIERPTRQSTYTFQLAAVVSGLQTGDLIETEGEEMLSQIKALRAIYAQAGIT